MIRSEDLNPHHHELSQAQQDNAELLAAKLSQLESAYGVRLVINRGFSTLPEQEAIYRGINSHRELQGLSPLKVPEKSAHLEAAAADISDTTGALWRWCMSNLALLEELHLYLEDRSRTPTWVHFQIWAPASGKRIFMP
jgi:hypothetical protein